MDLRLAMKPTASSRVALRAALLSTAVCAAPTPCGAQGPVTQTLLTDINLTPAEPRTSEPAVEGIGGGPVKLLCNGNGRELWETDGTPLGTRQIDGASAPLGFFPDRTATMPNGTLVVSALDGSRGRELYARPAGSTAGLTLIADLWAGGSSDPRSFALWNNELWFTAEDGTPGLELYRSDGTANGTTFVEDVPNSSGASTVVDPILIPTANGLFFLEQDSSRHLRFKANPATPSRRVLPGGSPLSIHRVLGVLGGNLLVGAERPAGDEELWISDGTDPGTMLLADLNRGSRGSEPAPYAHDGTRIWFTATTAATGRELWVTDGTASNTRMVRDLTPGSASTFFLTLPKRDMVPAFGGLVFVRPAFGRNFELWFTDGTGAGTRRIGTYAVDYRNRVDQVLLSHRGRVWFAATDATHGTELWSTDGTAAGTAIAADLVPGTASSDVRPVEATAGGLIVAADIAGTGAEPHIYDDLAGTVTFLANIAADPLNVGSEPNILGRHRNDLLFSATTDGTNHRLWRTDGTAAGTQLLTASPALTRIPQRFGRLDRGILFWGTRGSTTDLFISDGTNAGTRVLPVPPGRTPLESVNFRDRFWWKHGFDELWSTDGTPVGTARVTSTLGNRLFKILTATPDQRLVFGYYADPASNTGNEPWISDGTQAGTVLLADLEPGSSSSSRSAMEAIAFRDGVLFTPRLQASGSELWFSDATTAGTRMVRDIVPGPVGSNPVSLVSAGEYAVFVATDPQTGSELWRTDGTAAGTFLLLDASPGTGSANYTAFERTGDRVLFRAQTGPGIPPLYTTDGTVSGTVQISGNTVPTSVELLGNPVSIGDGPQAVLLGDAPSNFFGTELWVTDGTASGTRIVADSAQGQSSSQPAQFHRLADRVVFTADDQRTGIELHAIPLAATDSWVASPIGAGCGAAIGARNGAAVPGNSFDLVISATAPGSGVLLFDTRAAFDFPSFDCEINLAGPKSLLTFTTDPTGELVVPIPVPIQAAFPGLLLYFQSAIANPNGRLFGALEATPALEVVIGR